ncbi:MAG: CvpA family protein [Oscillospiraceae bacterium]|jgi:uncharacterized membrane protein required for colicin V production
MTYVVIDLVIVAILLISAWRGASKGLILSIAGLLAIIIAFYSARYIANNYSGKFTDVLEPFIGGIVDETATKELRDKEVTEESENPEIFESAKNILISLGFEEQAAEAIARKALIGITGLGEDFKNAIANKFMETLAYLFTFAISFLLISIVFAVILNLVNVVFNMPGLHILNSVGGGILGLMYGVMLVFVIAWLVRFLGFVLPERMVEHTRVLRWFMTYNPLIKLMGF